MHIAVEQGDALALKVDVLALKYAQALYGVDLAVADRLSVHYPGLHQLLPAIFNARLVNTQSMIAAKLVLFVGVEPLAKFGYDEIRVFARRVLFWLAREKPNIQFLGLTVHGVGYGLDETRAFEAELLGLLDAVMMRQFPPHLHRITIVELNVARAERLKALLPQLLPNFLPPRR